MKLKIAYYGNPVLRKKAEEIREITPEIRQLVADMDVAMEENNGMGLAAPQVGRSLRLFIAKFPLPAKKGRDVDWGPTVAYINPILKDPRGDFWTVEEACLSLPNAQGRVERPSVITIEYTSIEGERVVENLDGWPARIVMHENDHLNGVLFPDRMDPKERRILDADLRRLKKKYKDTY